MFVDLNRNGEYDFSSDSGEFVLRIYNGKVRVFLRTDSGGFAGTDTFFVRKNQAITSLNE
jgi:hypothetical protein